MVEAYGTVGIILLGLNVWAIAAIIGSNAATGAKVVWTLSVLCLPFLGFVIWLIAGPRGVRKHLSEK